MDTLTSQPKHGIGQQVVINMSRKSIIIIISTVAIVLFVSIIFLATNVDRKGGAETIKDESTFGAMVENHYYVEKGIEEPAEIAKLAVEEYLTNKTGETVNERNVRLKEYFIEDSPVFDNTSVSIESTAQVTSVTSCDEQEGGYWCLFVMAQIENKDQPVLSKTYWTTVQELEDGSFKVLDIGVWE